MLNSVFVVMIPCVYQCAFSQSKSRSGRSCWHFVNGLHVPRITSIVTSSTNILLRLKQLNLRVLLKASGLLHLLSPLLPPSKVLLPRAAPPRNTRGIVHLVPVIAHVAPNQGEALEQRESPEIQRDHDEVVEHVQQLEQAEHGADQQPKEPGGGRDGCGHHGEEDGPEEDEQQQQEEVAVREEGGVGVGEGRAVDGGVASWNLAGCQDSLKVLS